MAAVKMLDDSPIFRKLHRKSVIIQNNVSLRKETLRLEPDEVNPGKFLVAFTFDAEFAGSITVLFFAKEGEDGNLTPTKESLFQPVTVHFQQGLGQKFRQPSGSGIDFSMFEEMQLLEENGMDVYPLAVKAEASPVNQNGSDGNPTPGTTTSEITHAVFKKDKGEYQVRVVKQILWVNGLWYELHDIFESEICVICLSDPPDAVALPCQHMCMCSDCAKRLRFETNLCPICRQRMKILLQMPQKKVSNGPVE